jgi:predicted component of type VI protein secretion system
MGEVVGTTTRFVQATTGVNAGCTYALGSRSILGRSPTAHIQVMDPQVSREHACLELVEEGQTVLCDLSSANGTFVRGRRITEHRLRSGDTFRIGTSEFVFGQVRGDVVDTESVKSAIKVVGKRAMHATTLISEALETMRKKLTDAADQLQEEEADETLEEGCTDPLHRIARERGWAHCPACGESTGP